MTTLELKLNLPDSLANAASKAGLLSANAIEQLLRDAVKRQAGDDLFAAMDRMAAVDSPSVMSPEQVAEEIRAMREERRAKNGN